MCISVLIVGAGAMARSTMEGGLHLSEAVTMNCNSRNAGLHHDRSNMVLDSDWCNGDSNFLAHLAGDLLSHGGDHCGLHWHRDTLLDAPGVADIVDHHISDSGAGGLWDGVAHSPGDLPWSQVAHWFGHSDALLGGGALGHCHALGYVDALGNGDAVGNGNAVGHSDTLGDAGALGNSNTVRDSNASWDGGAPGNVDTDGGFDCARSLDGDASTLPPGDWLADRGDVMSNSNWSSNGNGSRCNSVADGNRSNSMTEGNWANSSGNRSNRSCHSGNGAKSSNSVGISFSFSIGLTPPARTSDGTKERSC